ncbi:unnamed protein product [Musa hybrid cultivar]
MDYVVLWEGCKKKKKKKWKKHNPWSEAFKTQRREKRKKKGVADITTMSGRSSAITDEEINELVSKLQSLLPESRRRRSAGRASASKLLKETCSYIKSLHREVEDLSDRLSDLMATMDSNSPQAEIIRSLLRP